MNTLNLFLTAILVLVVAYVLFRPGNQSPQIIHALGGASNNLTRTLTGQYAGGSY